MLWFCLFLILFPSFQEEPSGLTIISNLERKLQGIETLEADFVHIYLPAYQTRGMEERGHVYLKRPDRMRWDYQEPERKSFLLKGNMLLSYFYEDKQLLRQPLEEEVIRESILGLLAGKTRLLDLYSAEIVAREEKTQRVTLKLEPRHKQEISSLNLEIDTSRWLIVRIAFFEATGVRQEFLFSHYKINPHLPARTFDIPVPPDWEIIDSRYQEKKF